MSVRDIKIPKLPYGEGSISIHDDETLVYKKSIGEKGNKVREAVYGSNVAEVMKKMRIKESEYKEKLKSKSKSTLSEEISKWLVNTKQVDLKPKSYDRIETTAKNQIYNYNIGTMRYETITDGDIKLHIKVLVNEEYSWSTIKKCYDLLNEFFRYKTTIGDISINPMLTVNMPTKENVLKPIKEIEFFDDEDILKFEEEASKTVYNSNYLKYKLGYAFIAMIYLGVRAGEMIALRNKDIDMERRVIIINKSISRVINRKYDEDNKELMKKKGISKYIDIETSTKTNSTRILPINNKVYEALRMHFNYSRFTSPDDYVIPTRNGEVNNLTNMTRRLNSIQREARTKVQNSGLHVLRHTCASLYFRKNVKIEIIASLLGNSVEVCRTTYVHFIEEQKIEAASLISDFNIEL